jgi:hypothetical protein
MVPAIVSITFSIVARASEEESIPKRSPTKKHLKQSVESSNTLSNKCKAAKHNHQIVQQHKNGFEKHLKHHLRNDFPCSRCQFKSRKKDEESQPLLKKT